MKKTIKKTKKKVKEDYSDVPEYLPIRAHLSQHRINPNILMDRRNGIAYYVLVSNNGAELIQLNRSR